MGTTSNVVQSSMDGQGWDMKRDGGALPGVGTAEKPRQVRRREDGALGRNSRRRRQQEEQGGGLQGLGQNLWQQWRTGGGVMQGQGTLGGAEGGMTSAAAAGAATEEVRKEQ